jgi:hypothetical protein
MTLVTDRNKIALVAVLQPQASSVLIPPAARATARPDRSRHEDSCAPIHHSRPIRPPAHDAQAERQQIKILSWRIMLARTISLKTLGVRRILLRVGMLSRYRMGVPCELADLRCTPILVKPGASRGGRRDHQVEDGARSIRTPQLGHPRHTMASTISHSAAHHREGGVGERWRRSRTRRPELGSADEYQVHELTRPRSSSGVRVDDHRPATMLI